MRKWSKCSARTWPNSAPARRSRADAERSPTGINRRRTTPAPRRRWTDDVAQTRDKQCAEAQERYKKLIEGRRLYKTGDDGERQYLTSEEIDSERVECEARHRRHLQQRHLEASISRDPESAVLACALPPAAQSLRLRV